MRRMTKPTQVLSRCGGRPDICCLECHRSVGGSEGTSSPPAERHQLASSCGGKGSGLRGFAQGSYPHECLALCGALSSSLSVSGAYIVGVFPLVPCAHDTINNLHI